MANPQKHPDTGVYYLRVPDDLRQSIGKREIKQSLKTKDPTEAKRLFTPLYSEWLDTFALYRLRASDTAKVTGKDIAILVDRWYLQKVQEYERQGSFSPLLAYQEDEHPETGEPVQTIETEWSLVVSEILESGKPLRSILGDEVDRLLVREGISLKPGSEPYQRLEQGIAWKYRDLCELAEKREAGDWSTQPDRTLGDSPLSTEKPKGLTITEAFKAYREYKLAESPSAEKTLDEYETSIQLFASFAKDALLSEIKTRQIADFRDLLLKLPSKPKKHLKALPLAQQVEIAERDRLERLGTATVRNKLVHISALFTWAVESGRIADNPVRSGVLPKRASRRGQGPARDYTETEIAQIFASPMFTQGWQFPRADYGEAAFWVPLLCYYTGARPKELGQLYTRDLHQQGEIYFLKLDASAEDQSLKTESSWRDVPLHGDLIKLGFLNYVASAPKDGRMFPHLKFSGRSYTHDLGKRFGSYLRDHVSLQSTAKPLYGFRHAFKIAMRRAGVVEDVHDRLTGHAGESIGRTYGDGWLPILKEAIDKLPSVPGLENIRRP